MKTKLLTIPLILTLLIAWTGSAAWAKSHKGQRHRQEIKNHQKHGNPAHLRQRHSDFRTHNQRGKRLHHRQDRWERRAHKYQARHHRKHIRRHHYRPAPRVKRHYRGHHHPRRPVHRHKHHHYKNHGSGFLFGLSIHEPGMAFGIVLGDRY